MRFLLPLCAVVLTCTAADTVNLIVNGDFSSTDAGTEGPVQGWKGGDGRYVSVIDEDKNRFLRIAMPEKGTAMLLQKFTVEPGWQRIDVSVKIRAKGMTIGDENYKTGMLQYAFRNAKGEVVGGWSKRRVDADQDWTPMTESIEVPADAENLQVECWAMDCVGTFDFDDVKVELTKKP